MCRECQQQNEKFSTNWCIILKCSTLLGLLARLGLPPVVLPREIASNAFFNFGCAFLKSLVLTTFETPEGLDRRHNTIAKLMRPTGDVIEQLGEFCCQRRRVSEAELWCRGDTGELDIANVHCWLFDV